MRWTVATFELALQTLYTALARYSVRIPISSPPKIGLPTIVTIYRDGINLEGADRQRSTARGDKNIPFLPSALVLCTCSLVGSGRTGCQVTSFVRRPVPPVPRSGVRWTGDSRLTNRLVGLAGDALRPGAIVCGRGVARSTCCPAGAGGRS